MTVQNAHIDIDQHILRQIGGIDIVIKICTTDGFPSSLISIAIKV